MKELALKLPEVTAVEFFSKPNYEIELDNAVELTTGLVYDLENEQAMKADATAINQFATQVDKLIASAYKELTESAGNRRTLLKSKTKKLFDNRQSIIDQFSEKREAKLVEIKSKLISALNDGWVINDVSLKFRKSSVDALVKLNGVLTPSGALTKSVSSEINRLVAEDKAAQTQYETRLMLIENKCLRAEINPPLTVESFGESIYADDFTFNDKLDVLIDIELKRRAETVERVKRELEAENQRKLDHAIKLENDRINAENKAILAKKQAEQDELNRIALEEAKLQQQAEANRVAIIAEQTRQELQAQKSEELSTSFTEDFSIPFDDDAPLIDTETGEVIEMPTKQMPTVQEMIDHLSHHYAFERHAIREALRKEFNQAKAA